MVTVMSDRPQPRLARHAANFLVRFAVRDHAKRGHSHFSHAGQPARTIFSVKAHPRRGDIRTLYCSRP